MDSDSRLCWIEPVVLRQLPHFRRDLNDGHKENCEEVHWFAVDRLSVANLLRVAEESAVCVTGGELSEVEVV